jgi:hypothetical protein
MPPRVRVNIPTLVATAIVAWASANVLHEILGHAGAALLLGIPVRAVSTTTASIDWSRIQSITEYRVIHVGGTAGNLITEVVALLALYRLKTLGSASRYFLWLFAAFSSVIVTLNLISAPLIGGGDWVEVLTDVAPQSTWKAVIIAVGVVLATVGYYLPLRLWMPKLTGHRLARLCVTGIPVITVIIMQSLSLLGSPFATLPPESNHLLASVFAYFHFVLWMILVNVISWPRSERPVESISLPRSNTVCSWTRDWIL